MAAPKRALIVGLRKLNPSLKEQMAAWVKPQNLAYISGLTNKQLQQDLASMAASLESEGIRLENVLVEGEIDDAGIQRSCNQLRQHLCQSDAYDVVVLGAGIRGPLAHLPLFESLVNVTHRHAPSARIAFNTYPLDTAEAIKRALAAKEE
ncbi:unnamed protein product [Symbiodinium natans]|uniref:Uncharacterized protein n=1 Tax=Symbiodinium natans TaxID=878477 RepID=A0A812S270_9DINO|nr:unnamed protein product [Symbiodinium natans]